MSTTEKPAMRKFDNPRDAYLAGASYLAEEKFMQRTIDRYKKSERFKKYLKRDPVEREKEIQKLEESGRLKDSKDIVLERAEYIIDEEFKRQHMERYKQTDRYKEYVKRMQAENDKTN